MISGQSTSSTNGIAGLIDRAGAKIADSIRSASAATGVDFTYLMQQAQVESSFQSDAKAATSSATGLYQFTEGTWLQMVNKYGDKYGLGELADQISDTGKVSSKAVRKDILALRNDPQICSLMAGELAAQNKDYLESCTSCDIGSTELYMAHFMGAGGAAKFLNAKEKTPQASAADMFPQAAAANKNIFYTASGKERSLSEVYNLFDKKFQIASNACSATPATTSTSSTSEQNNMAKIANSIVKTVASTTAPATTVPTAKAVSTRTARTTDTAYNPHKNYGGIPGLQSLSILPVDVLALMKIDDHKNSSRYNG